jgi:hypothetical protein
MRIEGFFNGQSLNRANALDILGRLDIGDVIKAKVLEMTSGELMLKLFDGTVFKAAAAPDIDARPGELLELAVSGKGDGSITLETVKKNIKSESVQNEIKKLLISMDITPGPENMELAGEFKAAGLRLEPGVFKKAAELISRFGELTPEKAVFLAAKDIAPEEGRIGALVTLLEGRLKLGKQLDGLQTALSASIAAAAEKASAAKPAAATPPNPTPEFAAPSKPEAAELPQASSKTPPDRTLTAALPDSQHIDAANARSNLLPKQNSETAPPAPLAGSGPQSVAAASAEAARVPAGAAGTVEPSADKPLAPAGTEDGLEIERPDTGKARARGLKILEGEAGELEKLKDSFKSLFVRTDSEELKSELEVRKLYKDLTEKLDTIKSAVAYSGLPGADEITGRLNSLNDGLRLLNQINYGTAYYQIPLNISGFNTTGELYVMKRGHPRKRIDPRDATMFISLDTQNIGRIETIIGIKGKNVSMNLRAADQKIIDFIKENSRYLYNGLVEKGYRLVDIKYRLIEDEATPVTMERVIKKELESGRYSVDMRI